MFIGYSLIQSAFLCLDVSNSHIYTFCHVVFHETSFPFSSLTHAYVSSSLVQTSPSASPSATFVPIYRQSLIHQLPLSSAPSQKMETVAPTEIEDSTSLTEHTSPTVLESSHASPATQSQPTVSTQHQEPPAHTHHMTTRAKNQIHKLNPKYDLITQLTEIEPKTIAQALKDERWRRAMGAEIDVHIRHGIWDLVPPDVAHNVVGCKWVFTIKCLSDGYIDRFKAHLVAKGFHP